MSSRDLDRGSGGGVAAPHLFNICRGALGKIDQASKLLVVASMAVMATVVVIQVVSRYVFSSAFDWSEEVARLAFVWAIFLAIPHGVRLGIHVGIDVVVSRFSEFWQARIFRLSAGLGAVLMAVVGVVGGQVTAYTWPEMMPTLNLTAAVYYVAVLIAAAHSLLHLLLLAWGGPGTWPEETPS